jgi:hypothetical protein
MALQLDIVDTLQLVVAETVVLKLTQARIDDGRRLQNVAVLVVPKIQGMGDARVRV